MPFVRFKSFSQTISQNPLYTKTFTDTTADNKALKGTFSPKYLDVIAVGTYFHLDLFINYENVLLLLRLRETHNALQLPVFFFFSFFSFFSQPYPEYRGIRSNKLF